MLQFIFSQIGMTFATQQPQSTNRKECQLFAAVQFAILGEYSCVLTNGILAYARLACMTYAAY